MEEQEKLNIINNKTTNRTNNWRFKSDAKKFGWGCLYKKNRRCKKFGYGIDKEHRKNDRKFIKFIRHKIFKNIPLTDEEINKSKYYFQLSEELKNYLK
jgi:hypothetical protein